jgi:hypothetical protein
MESRTPPVEELRILEILLSSGEGTAEELSRLLADDCVEFGSSGQSYNKQQILESVKQSGTSRVSFHEFQARYVGPNVALVTYLASRQTPAGPVCSWRSSIWKHVNSGWQLVFHQGTPTPCPELPGHRHMVLPFPNHP